MIYPEKEENYVLLFIEKNFIVHIVKIQLIVLNVKPQKKLKNLKKNLNKGCMRMKQKKVWLLSGAPGSGKTSWAKKQIAQKGGVHCSRDEIRFSLLKDGEDYFAHEDEVIDIWFEKIKKAIENPEVEDIYVDATHLTEKSRANVLNKLPKGDYLVIIVFFDIPLETCIERNEQRTGRAFVPPSVIRRMYASYDKNTTLGDVTLYLKE